MHGKTQLFHLWNPRIHTDKGYQRTEKASALTRNKCDDDEIDQNLDDQEAVLRSQLELLLPQVNLVRFQLSPIVG